MNEGGAPVDEDARRRLEADRIAGGAAPLETFAPPSGSPAFAATVEELIAIDLEFRWKRWREGRADSAPDLTPYASLLAACGDAAVAARIAAEHEMLRARTAAAPELRPGLRLGHHVLRSLEGRGAFAELWRAWDESLGREVAVKVPRTGTEGDAASAARFLREARSAARLRHPGIVTVHEVGEWAGHRCIVSDFIPGGTLADRVRGGATAADDAARLVLALAEALDYAHQFGVVHRDVKPGNVLLDADGRPLLADFGLASLRSADPAITRDGDVLGTPGYMAPEQVAGAAGAADARTDVYGAGAVLYALLTGAAPFPGRSVESVLYAVIHEDPAAPSARVPGVPRDLERICLKALARSPADRYATARALAEDLRRFLAREPVAASAPSPLRRVTLWARREPRVAATVAFGALGIAAALAAGIVGIDAERRRTKSHLYRALVSEAEAVVASHSTDWLGRVKRSVRDAAACDVPERDERALRDLVLLGLGTRHASLSQDAEWPPDFGAPLHLAVSPDGSLAAVATESGGLSVRRVSSGEVVASVTLPHGAARALAYIGGGSSLLVAHADGALLAHDPVTLSPRGAATRTAEGAFTAIAVSRGPGTECVAAGLHGGSIAIWSSGVDDVAAKPSITLDAHAASITALAFTGDGRHVVSAGEDRMLRLWSTSDGKLVAAAETSDPPRSVACDDTGSFIAWCAWETAGWAWWRPGARVPTGSLSAVHASAARWLGLDAEGRVETVSADGTLRVWAQSGAPLAAAGPGRSPYVTGAVIPGGVTTLAARKDGAIELWRSAEARGREFFGTRHGARFIPGSARIATCAGILDVGADGRIAGGESVHADAAQVWGVAVSPDGRLIATSAHDGAVRLRDAATFAEIRTLRASGPLAWAVAFDPAGRRVAACCGNEVVVWDVGVGGRADPVGVLTGHTSAASAVAFDPVRPRIVTTSADGEARVWDSATLAPMGVLHRAPAALRDIAFSRDGGALAAACDDGTVLVWRSGLGIPDLPVHPESTLDAGAGAVWAVAFDPAGEMLAAGTERSAVTLFAAGTGESLATLRADVGRVRALSFDDAGRRLAAGCYVGASILWDLPALRESLREAGVDWDDPRR